MLSADDNDLLTRTGAGTPMGEYFRRFWLPVALSSELPEPDGAPIRVTVMGEELVAFRDTNGRVGLVEPRCAHRGSNLFFGRNEECGLRCVYHGWKFDVERQVRGHAERGPRGHARQDFHPGLPDARVRRHRVGLSRPARGDARAAAPGVRPAAGGASLRHQAPAAVQLGAGHGRRGRHRALFLPAHAGAGASPTPGQIAADESRMRWMRHDPMPQFTIVDHDVGFVVGGARKADGKDLYWRITQFMLPSHSITPSTMPGETYFGYTWVPIDDESCWIYVYAWHPERAITAKERATFDKGGYGQFAELGPGYMPLRNRSNDYQIDRAAQKNITFTGVRGIAEQDTMVQESQGPIADRTKENLTATDIGVVHFRRLMLKEAKNLRAGKEPPAAQHPWSYRLRSGGAVLPSGLSFAAVMEQRFGSPTGKVTK